jgi:hypothetical protein
MPVNLKKACGRWPPPLSGPSWRVRADGRRDSARPPGPGARTGPNRSSRPGDLNGSLVGYTTVTVSVKRQVAMCHGRRPRRRPLRRGVPSSDQVRADRGLRLSLSGRCSPADRDCRRRLPLPGLSVKNAPRGHQHPAPRAPCRTRTCPPGPESGGRRRRRGRVPLSHRVRVAGMRRRGGTHGGLPCQCVLARAPRGEWNLGTGHGLPAAASAADS